jgi:uncharacterized protein (TIGR03437 family)
MCAAAQPQIGTNGIVNGASFVYAGLPNGPIAQGSIFSIFGAGLGPATPVGTTSFPLPAAGGLAGVRAEVTPAGSNTAISAILIMVSSGQINAILPSSVPAGSANVTVTFNNQTSNAQQITVVPNSFGIFAINEQGSGPAVAVNSYSSSAQALNALNESAHPGQTVTLWGTGLGPVTFDETQPPGGNAKDMTNQTGVMVSVGGVAIKPQYAGRITQFPGVDEINFQLPQGIVPACYVPVTVKVNGIVSNTATMSIAPGTGPGTTCTDDFTVLPASPGQGFRTGSIVLTRTSLGGQNFDSATATFEKFAGADILKTHGVFGVSTYGACTTFIFDSSAVFNDTVQVSYLDAGQSLTLTLPDSSTQTLTRSAIMPGIYSVQTAPPGLPAPFLVPGSYRIAGTGGADVGAFTASLTVPQLLNWTNANSIPAPIPRNAPLQVTWTGGGQDAVLILGDSMLSDGTGAGFYCLAKAQDQQFTIPVDVLSVLPATASIGSLGVGDLPVLNSAQFLISPTPGGLDAAMFLYEFLTEKAVSYQ